MNEKIIELESKKKIKIYNLVLFFVILLISIYGVITWIYGDLF